MESGSGTRQGGVSGAGGRECSHGVRGIQVHYVITTAAERPENADLAGTFHITSTWRNMGGRWKLVFNMDRNVPER